MHRPGRVADLSQASNCSNLKQRFQTMEGGGNAAGWQMITFKYLGSQKKICLVTRRKNWFSFKFRYTRKNVLNERTLDGSDGDGLGRNILD